MRSILIIGCGSIGEWQLRCFHSFLQTGRMGEMLDTLKFNQAALRSAATGAAIDIV